MTRSALLQRARGPGSSEIPRVVWLAPAAVVLGLVVGRGVWNEGLTESWWYLPSAGLLLATGLYGSTHGIDRGSVRRDLRTAVIAVTLGVLLKAAFIAGVMVALFRKPEYLVLGIAVAQIDPLSVAAMSRSRRMSERAKTLLAVWAAFDDPMTVLLSVYFSVVAFRLAGRSGSPGLVPDGGGVSAYLLGIALNVLLCAAAVATWYGSRWAWNRYADRSARKRKPARREPAVGEPAVGAARGRDRSRSRSSDVLALLVVVALVLTAAASMLMLAVALTGLLVRTGRFAGRVDQAVTGAFLLSSFALGVLLTGGASLFTGFALGVAAFAAQAAVALVIVPLTLPRLPRSDKIYLALGQQNGITAIILALALEPDFPGTVGIVGPAVLTISVLYYATNGVWARRQRKADAAESDPGEPRNCRSRTRARRRPYDGGRPSPRPGRMPPAEADAGRPAEKRPAGVPMRGIPRRALDTVHGARAVESVVGRSSRGGRPPRAGRIRGRPAPVAVWPPRHWPPAPSRCSSARPRPTPGSPGPPSRRCGRTSCGVPPAAARHRPRPRPTGSPPRPANRPPPRRPQGRLPPSRRRAPPPRTTSTPCTAWLPNTGRRPPPRPYGWGSCGRRRAARTGWPSAPESTPRYSTSRRGPARTPPPSTGCARPSSPPRKSRRPPAGEAGTARAATRTA